MPLLNNKTSSVDKFSAESALNLAIAWVDKHDEPLGSPVTAQDWALISIATSLVELSRDARRRP
jgi:hypothetical protein